MMNRFQAVRNEWLSPWTFVFAATGVAVGLGNVWRFPYLLDVYGPAFLVAYVVMLAVFGFPLLLMEVSSGKRRAELLVQANTLRLVKRAEAASLTVAISVVALYSVVGGMGLAFLFFNAFGDFVATTPQHVVSVVSVLQGSPRRLTAWVTLFLLIVVMVSFRGAGRGVGRALTVIMPMFFLALLMLALFSFTSLDVAGAWQDLVSRSPWPTSLRLWVDAALQCFYSLAVGMGAMLIYGSYMPAEQPVNRYVVAVVALDTLASLLAAVFVLGVGQRAEGSFGSGFGLVFFALPLSLGQLPSGQWVGSVFFLMVTLAAWSSAVGVLEPVVAKVQRTWAVSRRRAVLASASLCWLLSGLLAATLNYWRDMVLLGHNIMGWWSAVTAILLIPLAVFALIRVRLSEMPTHGWRMRFLILGVLLVAMAGLTDFVANACHRDSASEGWCGALSASSTPPRPVHRRVIILRDDLSQDPSDNDALPQWPLGEEEQ